MPRIKNADMATIEKLAKNTTKNTRVAAKNVSGSKKKKSDRQYQKTLGVTLVRSVIGAKPDHCHSVRGLGLRRIGQTVFLKDDPCIRGMINKVSHLLLVTTAEERGEGF